MIFFWVAYEHNDNLWVFFAQERMDLSLPKWLGGGDFSPGQFQFVNAALILVFVPSPVVLAKSGPDRDAFSAYDENAPRILVHCVRPSRACGGCSTSPSMDRRWAFNGSFWHTFF